MAEASERRDFRRIRGMDPRANWLFADAVDDFLPDSGEPNAVPFLLELVDDEAVAAFQDLPAMREGAKGNGALVLGFGAGNKLVEKDRLLPVIASRAWFERLLTDDRPSVVRFRDANKQIVLSSPAKLPRRITEAFPDFEEQELLPDPEPVVQEAKLARTAEEVFASVSTASARQTVVMAAIDDGFGFVHERFRDRDGKSRVHGFWDMNRIFPANGGPAGELSKGDIDTLIGPTPTAGGLDEDAVYRAEGLLDFGEPRHKPLAWRVSHGTHVLDLVAGYDPVENATHRPILAMQLPTPVVARTTGELLDFYLWLGVLYAVARADKMGPQPLPLVINISFGYEAGSHDGLGLLDRFFDRQVQDRAAPTRIVLPAGNAQLSRCHASIDLSQGAAVDVEWIVLPDDRTHSFIEIWLPPGPAAFGRMRLTVTPPGGLPATIDEAPGAIRVVQHGGKNVGLVELVERLDDRRHFRVSIRPTARPEPNPAPMAPAGVWTLRFAPGDTPMSEVAHAWIQRDDSLYGYPQRGRQSYFDHEDYVRYDDAGFELDEDPPPKPPGAKPCPVTRASLLNAISSGADVIVAGGYRQSDGRIATYSAGGPNAPAETDPQRRKPDVLMPSDGSVALSGILAAGGRSGARVAQNGTSVAAPQLARRVADLMAVGLPSDRAAVFQTVIQAMVQVTGASDDRGGFGGLPRPDTEPVERYSDR